MTVQPNTDFQALAQGAAYCREFGGSFVLYVDGKADDSFDTLDDAANAYVDCWDDWDEVKVLEFAPSGAFSDVTKEARDRVELWCANRGELAPWGDEESGESDHDMQRSVAYISGYFS